MVKGMHHLAICVNNLDASMKFYHEILGWEITRSVKGPEIDAYYVQIPGSGELEFVERHGKQVNTPLHEYQTCFHHMAVEVDDPNPYYEKLKANGYEFIFPVSRFDIFGHYTCGVIDPDGIMVEFITPYPPVEAQVEKQEV